ncbi:MAG: HDOD domain-containing protein [Candidatus Lernaella stagnicola]|nr:HDOD domain-containing protein [Candidatus Lernaella stagnicola]
MSDADRLKLKVKCPHCGGLFVVNAPVPKAKLSEVEPEAEEAAASPESALSLDTPSTPTERGSTASGNEPESEEFEDIDEEEAVEVSPEEEAFRERVIKAILARDFDLPMLPHVALKVIRLTSDEDASMQDLAKVILTDQTIAAKIISIANSPVYAGVVEINNINQALVRLGQTEVKNLMLAISLQTKIFKSRLYGRLAKRLWERAVGVAFASRVVASATNNDKNESFLAGLMHNIGRMISLTVIESAQRRVEDDFRPQEEMIENIVEQYQRDVGELTVEKWTLPSIVNQVVRFYGRPEEQIKPEPAVAVVGVGELLCIHTGIGSEKPEEVDFASQPAVKMLRLEPETTEDLVGRFQEIFESAKTEIL